MASTACPLVPPMSPVVKRSTRKRQRPTFFAEEIEAAIASSSSTKKHSSSSGSRSSSRHKHGSPTESAPQHHHHSRRSGRSQLSELHDTVSDLRAQIESATVQMQELRSLVTLLADLYRGERDSGAVDEPKLFSATSSEQDSHEEQDVFSTTSSEHDMYEGDEEDLFSTPLSPLLP